MHLEEENTHLGRTMITLAPDNLTFNQVTSENRHLIIHAHWLLYIFLYLLLFGPLQLTSSTVHTLLVWTPLKVWMQMHFLPAFSSSSRMVAVASSF